MVIGVPVADIVTIREDEWGNGHFGAKRGENSDGSIRFHDGVDIEVEPGDPIFSMIDGVIEKVDYPYGDDLSWTGIQICNQQIRTEIWYMAPSITHGFVSAGQKVGVAQDISLRYPPNEKIPHPMTPHIHVRVTLKAFTVLANGRYVSYEIYVDPNLFIGE